MNEKKYSIEAIAKMSNRPLLVVRQCANKLNLSGDEFDSAGAGQILTMLKNNKSDELNQTGLSDNVLQAMRFSRDNATAKSKQPVGVGSGLSSTLRNWCNKFVKFREGATR